MPRKVAAEDLQQLPQVKALLQALNDPYVGLQRLAMLLDGVPVLKSRCQYQAFLRRPALRVDSSELVLGVIGNKGLEAVLFGVLEDLTILKAELEDEEPPSVGTTEAEAGTVTLPRIGPAPVIYPRVSYAPGSPRMSHAPGSPRMSVPAGSPRVSVPAGSPRVSYAPGLPRANVMHSTATRVSYAPDDDARAGRPRRR